MARYSETLSEHVMALRNSSALQNPDRTGHAGTRGRGAFMVLFLKLDDARMAAAKY